MASSEVFSGPTHVEFYLSLAYLLLFGVVLFQIGRIVYYKSSKHRLRVIIAFVVTNMLFLIFVTTSFIIRAIESGGSGFIPTTAQKWSKIIAISRHCFIVVVYLLLVILLAYYVNQVSLVSNEPTVRVALRSAKLTIRKLWIFTSIVFFLFLSRAVYALVVLLAPHKASLPGPDCAYFIDTSNVLLISRAVAAYVLWEILPVLLIIILFWEIPGSDAHQRARFTANLTSHDNAQNDYLRKNFNFRSGVDVNGNNINNPNNGNTNNNSFDERAPLLSGSINANYGNDAFSNNMNSNNGNNNTKSTYLFNNPARYDSDDDDDNEAAFIQSGNFVGYNNSLHNNGNSIQTASLVGSAAGGQLAQASSGSRANVAPPNAAGAANNLNRGASHNNSWTPNSIANTGTISYSPYSTAPFGGQTPPLGSLNAYVNNRNNNNNNNNNNKNNNNNNNSNNNNNNNTNSSNSNNNNAANNANSTNQHTNSSSNMNATTSRLLKKKRERQRTNDVNNNNNNNNNNNLGDGSDSHIPTSQSSLRNLNEADIRSRSGTRM